MSEPNPFESPQTVAENPTTRFEVTPEWLLGLAKRQRWLLFALLICIVTEIVALVLPSAVQNPEVAQTTFLALLVVSIAARIFSLVSIVSICRHLDGWGPAILAFLLSLLPLINLIVLLVMNQRATKTLREYGYTVGFMGADLTQFKASTLPRIGI